MEFKTTINFFCEPVILRLFSSILLLLYYFLLSLHLFAPFLCSCAIKKHYEKQDFIIFLRSKQKGFCKNTEYQMNWRGIGTCWMETFCVWLADIDLNRNVLI
jgi:hypothetical protein